MFAKTLEIWGHWGAPNPWKVIMVLEELSVPYTIHLLEFSEVKDEPFLKINPNGRLPAIRDPNNDLILWESGAIIGYLVDQYDIDGKISYRTGPEKYLTQQWLAFQISGQGPYFGQATWFARFHAEKLPSAIDRYISEIFRVTGVIESGLRENGTGWLVGARMTYADLAFVTWASVAEGLLKEIGQWAGFEEKFPKYTGWLKEMAKREPVRKAQETIAKGRAEHGL